MAQELSGFLEMNYPPEQMRRAAWKAVMALEVTEKLFRDRHEPRPRALAHVLILIRRADAGLDPRGR
jgi:hypothetical protein